jgi:hypothetical protein
VTFDDYLPQALAFRGYALTALGLYREALETLSHVIPLTHELKKQGIWITFQAECALPYALIPFCEYMLDPTEPHRIAAWKGREKYMNQITRNECRFNSYFYYYHLAEAYPEVYVPPVKKRKAAEKKPEKENPSPTVLSEIPEYPGISTRDDEPGEGGVVIADAEDNSFGFVFRTPSFERFINKIISLPGYPVLSDALNAFSFSTSFDPEAVIIECNGLLKEPSLTIEEREAVGEIGKIAMHARDHGAKIQFLYNEYW